MVLRQNLSGACSHTHSSCVASCSLVNMNFASDFAYVPTVDDDEGAAMEEVDDSDLEDGVLAEVSDGAPSPASALLTPV